jgi:hypothetical protein
MNGELAGAADIITGTAVARAVEPEAGEGHAVKASNCLNCGTSLIGAHCHACGQKSHVHRTLHEFGHDILHSVLHFDGKIWRTLPMLFWKPGELTRRYVHGERAKFVSPLASFLFTVFLTFAAFNTLVPNAADVNAVIGSDQAEEQYQEDRADILKDITGLEADKKEALEQKSGSTDWMDREIERHRKNLAALDETRGKDVKVADLAQRKMEQAKAKSDTNIARLEEELKVASAANLPTEAIEKRLEAERVDARVMRSALSTFGKSSEDEVTWTFTDLKFPGSDRLNAAVKHAAENPQLLFYKMQSNTYKYSWALIPISVPFVWLLFFWRRQFKMFDHAVFVTYSLTFMMLLGVICAVLIQYPGTEPIGGIALAFAPPIHMYRQLRGAYQTSRFGALWRTCLLSAFAMTALVLFAMLIVTLGVTG